MSPFRHRADVFLARNRYWFLGDVLVAENEWGSYRHSGSALKGHLLIRLYGGGDFAMIGDGDLSIHRSDEIHFIADDVAVYTGLEAPAHPNRLVGFAYQALREACWSEHAQNLVIVDYDLLVQRPAEVLKLSYDFLGEPYFPHDFECVDYDAPEFDSQLGVTSLHKVDPKVSARPRQTIPPPDLFERHSNMAFWRDLKNCCAFSIVQQPGPPQHNLTA